MKVVLQPLVATKDACALRRVYMYHVGMHLGKLEPNVGSSQAFLH